MTILSGTHTRAVDGHGRAMEFGSGKFVVDWDMAQTLPEHDNTVGGDVHLLAPRAGRGDDHRRRLQGHQGRSARDRVYDALYRYSATPGAGGELKYAAKQDYYPDPHPPNSAKEDFTLHSRWQETGAGRTTSS